MIEISLRFISRNYSGASIAEIDFTVLPLSSLHLPFIASTALSLDHDYT
jgi:hypothetical protein